MSSVKIMFPKNIIDSFTIGMWNKTLENLEENEPNLILIISLLIRGFQCSLNLLRCHKNSIESPDFITEKDLREY